MENSEKSNYRNKIDRFSSHSIIIQALEKLSLSSKQILDIGCYRGDLLNRLREASKFSNGYSGADLTNNLDTKFEDIDFIKCDLNDKELDKVFKNKVFDVVILADILEHLVDPWDAILNLKKIIKSDSFIAISLPNSGHWFFRFKVLFGQIDYESNGLFDRTHLRFFTKKTAKELILNKGYKISELKYSSLPWENLFNSRLLTKTLSVIERSLIFIRPQFFAYQFIFIVSLRDL